MRYIVYLYLILGVLSLQGCSTTYSLATHEEETILMSSDKEVNMGRKLSKQVEKKFELDPDILIQNRIKEIGKKIAAVCDRQSISYHFAVLTTEKEDMINAFALPGGYLYVFRPLVDKVENDDELAAVIAHEVGHITARHSAKRAQGSLGDTALRMLLALSNTETSGATRARINEALNQLMLSYSREDEIMADKLSIKYLRLAGYNPEGAVKFLERLMDIRRKGPIKRYHRYRSHPYLSERIAITREEVYGRMDFRDYINRSEETLPIK